MAPDEMFPPSTLDKLAAMRAAFIAASEKADEGVERAEAKAFAARALVYQVNEVIDSLKKGADAATGEVNDA